MEQIADFGVLWHASDLKKKNSTMVHCESDSVKSDCFTNMNEGKHWSLKAYFRMLYNQTCVKQTPKGILKSGCLIQVTVKKVQLNFNILYLFSFDWDLKNCLFILFRWLLNKGGL